MRIRIELHRGRLVACYADRPATVQAMLHRSFADAAGRLAIVDGPARLTYAEVAHRSATVAAGLAARGVGPGDRVAVMLDNGLDAVLSVAGIARLGAVLVPLGTRLRAPEIAYILGNAEPAAVIHGAAFASEVAGAGAADGGCLDTSSPAWRTLGQGVAASPPVAAAEDDVFAILYTSGTTGRPKGAMLTHLNVVHSCLHWQEVHRLGPDDRTLLCVPWSHVTGLCGVLLPFLHAAGTVVTMAEFKRRRFLELAQQEGITHALMVPAMYNLCLLEPDLAAFDLSSWRIGAFGGAPMPAPTVERFARAFPGLQLRDCYGATETASPATITPLGAGADRAGSVGRPVPCGHVIIMDEEGREVGPGERGEIWIAGPMVVPGYWRAPAAEEAAFAGGYWKSGDIGSIGADGYVSIADRKKDMITRAGFKIYPAEVESALAGLDGVIEAAVVGRPDDMLGEAVAAFLYVADRGPTAAQVRAWCAARMADYKVPQHIIIASTPLPRNANGKIQKGELRAALAVSAAEGQA
jgi:acyl-CoA synthetase (AMP-forming)/AMP-acid ligase II